MASRRADKWVHDVCPTDLVSKAAKRALNGRLRYLWSQLKLAAKEPEKDLEYVHQTRVASRRAIAAIDTFQNLLPRKRSKKLRKRVSKVRKAAGGARDDDVLLMRLDQLIAADPSPGLLAWRAEVKKQRRLHQAPVVKIYEHLHKSAFKSQVKRLTKQIRWRADSPEPTYHESAVQTLQKQHADFEPTLSGELPSLEQLHPFRIAGKQLRYELELFAGAFASDWIRKGVYPSVSKLQEMLGHVNDHVTAIERMQRWRDSTMIMSQEETLSLLIQEEQIALEKSLEAVALWWEAGSATKLLEDLRALSVAD